MASMRSRFHDEQLQFKAPGELLDAVANIARKRMMSRSAYIRQSVLEQLRRDGIEPAMEGVGK
jgi:predicted transcriptional regulator